MTARTVARQVARAWLVLGHHWYWFRVFWALGVLAWAVGLLLVADPAPVATFQR